MSESERERIEHESFGLINFSKALSTPAKHLFGSSILHNNIVQLEIHSACLDRYLHRDWIHEKKILLSLDMSTTQFAEAITSMNRSGIPCTITFANGRAIKGTDLKNKRMQFDEEFTRYAEWLASKNNRYYQNITEILNKKHIGKKDRIAIQKELDYLKVQIASNIPAIKKQFTAQMDKTVLEAKNAFDAFVDDRIKGLGLAGFKKQLLALTENVIQEASQ